MYKKILAGVVMTLFFAVVAFADQAIYISQKDAVKTADFLKTKTKITHFCAPCKDGVQKVEDITTVEAGPVGYEDFWGVKVNGENVDLAYVYYLTEKGKWKNVAMEMDIKVRDVPKYLPTLTIRGDSDKPANGTIVLADGRVSKEPKESSADDQKFADAEFAAHEASILKQVKLECDDDAEDGVTVLGTATGAFTKAGASQKAYLYERCRAGRSFGIGGIIIAEGGKAVTHYTFGENGLYNDINSSADINRNGFSELILNSSGTGQGYTESKVTLIEVGSGNISFLGSVLIYESNDGAVENEADALTSAYKITVKPGTVPVYSFDTFEKKGTAQDWSAAKTDQKFDLESEEPAKFVKIL